MRILNTTYIAPMPRTQSVSPASQCLPTEYTTYNNESREMPWSVGKPSPCVSRPQEIKFGQSRLGTRNREKSQRSQSSQVSARENTPYRREPQVQKRKERKERGRGAERSQRRADNSVVAAVSRTVFDLCLLPVETLSPKRSLNGLGPFATS